jgi:hypothetical protein
VKSTSQSEVKTSGFSEVKLSIESRANRPPVPKQNVHLSE